LDPDGVMDTRAVRWPLLEVMETGTSTCSTAAIRPSGTAPEAAGSGMSADGGDAGEAFPFPDLDREIVRVDAHGARGDGTDGGSENTRHLLFGQAGGNGLGPVNLHLDHGLAGSQVGGHLTASRNSSHGLDHGVAGLPQVFGGGRLQGDVHRGGRSEAALLGTDGDLAGSTCRRQFAADGVLQLPLVRFFVGDNRKRGIGGAGGRQRGEARLRIAGGHLDILDPVDAKEHVLDLPGRGAGAFKARAGRKFLLDRHAVLA
jgi:hypothetical protein